jgi:two-component system, OmpR family, sensor kinase
MRGVPEDRLTRQELGWLLMQEARGTARALRDEVSQIKTGQERPSEQAPPVDSMLDALDVAIDMVSALEAPSGSALAHGKDRRGRIDIAALLFDIAPNAKIAIEPGAGTEVFGVESELRRVLALLIEQSGPATSASSAIDVRRDKDRVVVSVALGPEGMSTRDLEHRWLHRMATRYGGRVEITGNVTRLCLPADTSSGQQEIQQLRMELEQAQQLGAVYARELAEAFTVATEAPIAVSLESKCADEPPLRVLVATTATVLRTLRFVTDTLRQDVGRVARVLGDQHELVTSLNSRLVAYSELMSDLERVSSVSLEEPPRFIEVGALLSKVVNAVDGRARRHDVTVSLKCEAALRVSSRPQILELLLRALVDQAILSTPRTGSVALSAEADPSEESSATENSSPPGIPSRRVSVSIVDGGPIVPESTHFALLLGQADPSAIGRAGAFSWITAGASAATLGIGIEVGESRDRRAEVRLTLG